MNRVDLVSCLAFPFLNYCAGIYVYVAVHVIGFTPWSLVWGWSVFLKKFTDYKHVSSKLPNFWPLNINNCHLRSFRVCFPYWTGYLLFFAPTLYKCVVWNYIGKSAIRFCPFSCTMILFDEPIRSLYLLVLYIPSDETKSNSKEKTGKKNCKTQSFE